VACLCVHGLQEACCAFRGGGEVMPADRLPMCPACLHAWTKHPPPGPACPSQFHTCLLLSVCSSPATGVCASHEGSPARHHTVHRPLCSCCLRYGAAGGNQRPHSRRRCRQQALNHADRAAADGWAAAAAAAAAAEGQEYCIWGVAWVFWQCIQGTCHPRATSR
jgi:hypothetical protein